MFRVLKENVSNSFIIQKSKFLTFGFFVKNKKEIKTLINKFKTDYADASHICYAYILDDNTYYYSDNGEPSGCAGQPIFNALKINKLNYCLFIVVRYFGGIKFGTGPLRSTFKNITLQTLVKSETIQSYINDIVIVEVPYDKISEILAAFKNKILKKDYQKEYVILNLVGKDCIERLKKFRIEPKLVLEKQIIF